MAEDRIRSRTSDTDRKKAGVVGLDLSLTGTGLARLEWTENGRLLELMTIGTRASFGTRLERYWETVERIRKEVIKEDVVFVEDFAYRIKSKQSSLATLGELNGVVKVVMWKWTRRQPMLIGQGQWKKFLCDNGALKKDEFKLRIYKKFKVECKTNDEAAAYAMADLGWHLIGRPGRKLSGYEVKIVNDLRKKYGEALKSPG